MTTKTSMFVFPFVIISLTILLCRATVPDGDDPSVKKLHFQNQNIEQSIAHSAAKMRTPADESSQALLNREHSSINNKINILAGNDKLNAKEDVKRMDYGNTAGDEDIRRLESVGKIGYPAFVENERLQRGIRLLHQIKRDIREDAVNAAAEHKGRSKRRVTNFVLYPIHGIAAMKQNVIANRIRRYA